MPCCLHALLDLNVRSTFGIVSWWVAVPLLRRNIRSVISELVAVVTQYLNILFTLFLSLCQLYSLKLHIYRWVCVVPWQKSNFSSCIKSVSWEEFAYVFTFIFCHAGLLIVDYCHRGLCKNPESYRSVQDIHTKQNCPSFFFFIFQFSIFLFHVCYELLIPLIIL